MPYDSQDTTYEDVISPDARISARSIVLPVILAILKRPWLSIGTIFLVMIPIIFYLYSLVPRYQSSAIASVASENRASLIGGSAMDAMSPWRGSDEFYFYLLDSYAYRDAINKRILEAYPHLPPDSISVVVSRDITHGRRSRGSSFVVIQTVSESPEFAQFTAEQAVAAFQDLSLKLRRSDAMHLADFIKSQLDELNRKLIHKEAELQTFLLSRHLTQDDVVSGVGSELRNLQRQLNESKSKRDLARLEIDTYNQQIAQRLNHYLNGGRDSRNNRLVVLRGSLDEINNHLNRVIVDSLVNDADSLLIQDLNLERKKILSDIINLMHQQYEGTDDFLSGNRISVDKLEDELSHALMEFQQALIQISYYQSALDRYLRDHPNLPQNVLEYFNMEREKSVLQKAIDILIEKHENIRIEMAAESGGIKIIDTPQIASKPIETNRGRKLAVAFLLAIVIGFAMAYVVDLFDNTVQGEIDISIKFNLPVYGSIPVLNLRGFRSRRRKPLVIPQEGNGQADITLLNHHSESSPVAEAYRSIRTSILFTARERQQKAFVISSAVAGEGKSLTTYNLGVSFGQGGSRTLIVDADFRRSAFHKMFNIDRSPGLVDYLFGNNTISDITVESDIENLAVITSGSKANNPADLLSSHKMRQFMDEVTPLYDIILFDSPPVTPCMDSRNLANIVGGLIYIVRAELTKLNILEHSISLLNRINVEINGVVVNYASFRYGYGYYYLYHRYHSYGYYSGGYQYYYYSYYQDSDSGEKVKKKKTKSKESSTAT